MSPHHVLSAHPGRTALSTSQNSRRNDGGTLAILLPGRTVGRRDERDRRDEKKRIDE